MPQGFDVVIDDGSHYVNHVISSFAGLFDHLKPKGLYVIEDLHVAAWRDWGSTAYNRGMDMEQDERGNDPEKMVSFLENVRARKDVEKLAVHLKKICFVRKSAALDGSARYEFETGDRLRDLFPPEPKRTFLQKVTARILRRF